MSLEKVEVAFDRRRLISIAVFHFLRQIGKMKKLKLFVSIGLFLLSLPSLGAGPLRTPTTAKDVGLGVVFGNPTAITGKIFIGREQAIDGGLSFAERDYFLVYGDYLVHYPGSLGHNNEFVSKLIPYVGAGAILVFANRRDDRYDGKYFRRSEDSFALGARIPLGVEWMAATLPIGVFLELAPGITIVPSTQGFIQAGLGVRYYF